jgi:hypothetical protein
MDKQSIMEKKMDKLGMGSRRKLSRLPNTLDEGIIEIAYLRALENMSRRRLRILDKIRGATTDNIEALEKERLSLERLFIPITHLPTVKDLAKQTVTPRKSREEVLSSWKGKSQAEIDELIKQLEMMKQG